MPKLLTVASVATSQADLVRTIYYALHDLGIEVFCELQDRVSLWGLERASYLTEKLKYDCDGVLFLYCSSGASCPIVRIMLCEAVARAQWDPDFVVVGSMLDTTAYSDAPAVVEWLELAPTALANEIGVRLAMRGQRPHESNREHNFPDLREYVRGLLSGRNVWRPS